MMMKLLYKTLKKTYTVFYVMSFNFKELRCCDSGQGVLYNS